MATTLREASAARAGAAGGGHSDRACLLCQRSSFAGAGGWVEISLKGRSGYLHRNCARFSPLVNEANDGRLSGVQREVQRGNRLVRLLAARVCV